jgi:hypothetical protein
MRFDRVIAAIVGVALAGTATAMTPIGTLTAEGRYAIRAAGDEQATHFNQDEYTFFSGDTVTARGGAVVVNLSEGGGLGLTEGGSMTVRLDDDGSVIATLESGSVLYAFPEGKREFRLRAGNFVATGSPEQARALQVSRGAGSIGTVELLEDGNVKASVREGSLFISNGASVRYQVDAGATVGLLDLPGQTIQTQSSSIAPGGGAPLILIQSPEQVSTREEFVVRWQAFDPVDGDYIVIAKEGAEPDEFESVISSDEGNVVEFEAPGSPGDYEIRFIDGESGEIKRFVYLDVVQDVVGAYWWDDPIVRGTMGVIGGATAIYIGSEIVGDDDPGPVSP